MDPNHISNLGLFTIGGNVGSGGAIPGVDSKSPLSYATIRQRNWNSIETSLNSRYSIWPSNESVPNELRNRRSIQLETILEKDSGNDVKK